MGGKILRRTEKNLAKTIRSAKGIIFFLDYDGTLTPIRKKPALATIARKTRSLLKKISEKKWAKIYIVSGRSLKNVKRLVGIRSLSYVGNHGIELEAPRIKWVHETARALKPAIQKVDRILRSKLKFKGIIVENKTYTLSLHYRLADPKKVPQIKKVFEAAIAGFKNSKKVKITRGKKVFEVRPQVKWDKGKVVKLILKKEKSQKNLQIYIGDDITDEDAFRILGKKAITILVSEKKRKTHARYRLTSPEAVFDFLKFILINKKPNT